MGRFCYCEFGGRRRPGRASYHRSHGKKDRRGRSWFFAGADNVRYRVPRPLRYRVFADHVTYVFPTFHPPVKGRPARNRLRAASTAKVKARRRRFASAQS